MLTWNSFWKSQIKIQTPDNNVIYCGGQVQAPSLSLSQHFSRLDNQISQSVWRLKLSIFIQVYGHNIQRLKNATSLHCIIFSYSTHIMAYCIQISHFTFQLIKGALQGSIRFQQGPMQLWYLQPRYLTYSPFASNKHRYKASQLFLKSKQGFFSPQHTNIAQQVRTFVTVIFDRWPIFPHQEIKRIT